MPKQIQYGLQKTLDVTFDDAVSKVTEALKAEGFGIISEVNMQATLKTKLDVDTPNYLILGACNPSLAYQAMQYEEAIGLLLPCNVLVYTDEASDGTHVAALEPALMVQLTENPAMQDIANEAHARLERVINAL